MIGRQLWQAASVQIKVVPADRGIVLIGSLCRRKRQNLRQLDQPVAVNIGGVDIVAADSGNRAFRLAHSDALEHAVLKRKDVCHKSGILICARHKDSGNVLHQISGQNTLDKGRSGS